MFQEPKKSKEATSRPLSELEKDLKAALVRYAKRVNPSSGENELRESFYKVPGEEGLLVIVQITNGNERDVAKAISGLPYSKYNLKTSSVTMPVGANFFRIAITDGQTPSGRVPYAPMFPPPRPID